MTPNEDVFESFAEKTDTSIEWFLNAAAFVGSNPLSAITQLLALTRGTRLGVYEVIASIGEGVMGQVFRARYQA